MAKTAAGSAALAGLLWLPRPVPAATIDVLEGTGLSFGCAVGNVRSDGSLVWFRTTAESVVSINYGKDLALKEYATSEPVDVTKETDLTAKIVLDGLEPKTTYYYRATVAGAKPGPICHFVTAPAPNDAADVHFAFSGDSRERFQPFSIMDSMRVMRPDFFLHLGDTIYADVDGPATELSHFRAKYRANRSDRPTQRLLSETSLYVVWDDHEVRNDYHPSDPLAPLGRRAFFDYWPVRQDPQDPHRLYRSFRWGKAVELFLLDTRQYRDPAKGTIVGERQKQWFLNALSSSSAWFKFVATSVPFSSDDPDKWGEFPQERREIQGFIASKRIPGVIFLAADVHYAAVSRVPGGFGLREFIAGPIGAPMGNARNTEKKFDFFSNESFNYGMVGVHANADPPYAEIEFLGRNNYLLHKTRIDLPQPKD